MNRYIIEMTEAILAGKFDPIHGMPAYLWSECRLKRTAIKLFGKVRTSKGRYYLLAYLNTKPSKAEMFNAIRTVNREYGYSIKA